MRHIRLIGRIRPIGPILLLLLALAAVARGGEYPLLSRSLFWERPSYDAETVSLFHLDDAAKEERLNLDDLLKEGESTPDGDAKLPMTEKSDNSAVNAVRTGNSAALRGSAKLVPEGRFRGSLHLAGPDGALLLPPHGTLPGRTIEFWLKLDSLPREDAVLVCCVGESSADKRPLPPVRLFLKPSGALAIDWRGESFGDPFGVRPLGRTENRGYGLRPALPTGYGLKPALRTGEWVHLAFGWSCQWPADREVHLLVDGKPVQVHKDVAGIAEAHELGRCVIGNDPLGKSGITGWIDEVRVSRGLRRFYAREWDPARPDRPLPASYGPPYWRDADDLLLHLPFDQRLDAPRAPAGFRSPSYQPPPKGDPLQGVTKHFQTGVHGAALAHGSGGLNPDYAGQGFLSPEGGTIAFWLRPLEWDNATRHNKLSKIPPRHVELFRVTGTLPRVSNPREGNSPASLPKVSDLREGKSEEEESRTTTRTSTREAGPLLTLTLHLNPSDEALNVLAFDPGRWTHLALAWQGTQVRTYVNGRRRDPNGAFSLRIHAAKPGDPSGAPDKTLWLASRPNGLSFKASTADAPRTLLDDFRVYRRPLAPTEVANLAALGLTATEETKRRPPEGGTPNEDRLKAGLQAKPLPPAELAVHSNGVLGRVRVEVTPLLPEYRQVKEVRLGVHKAGDAKPLGQATLAAPPLGFAQAEIKTSPLEFGQYAVEAELLAPDGRSLAKAEEPFAFAKPPWVGSRAGVSDKVMPGWDPIQAKDGVLTVCLREICLGPSGLPARIISAGEDVLASPIQIVVQQGGKPAELAAGEAKIAKRTDIRADWTGELRGPDWRLGTQAYIEYDGMMWFEFTLEPKAGAQPELSSFVIRIPYRTQNAELLHWWSGSGNFRDPRAVRIGALPAGEGIVFRSNDREKISHPPQLRGSFIPYVLLAGDDRGLAYFAENDRGWTPSTDAPAVAIERQGDAVTLVLSIISQPVRLDGPRRFAFGLHPIPTKRLPPSWRRHEGWCVFPDTFCGNILKGEGEPFAFDMVPENGDWAKARRRLDGLSLSRGAPGIKNLHLGALENFRRQYKREPRHLEIGVPGLYLDMQWTGNFPGHTREFAEAWWRPGDLVHYTPEFIDFASWCLDAWVRETNQQIRGVYFDDCWGAPQVHPEGPVAYRLPDGHVQPGYQLRRFRERFKRARQVFYDAGVEPQLCAHTTHTFFVPYHSFFDIILDGEDFYSTPPNQGDFIDHWPPDRLRFMNSRKWGLTTEWLGWTGGGTKTANYPAWTFRQTRAYQATLGVHDIRHDFSDAGFGIREDDVEFVPYWAVPRAGLHALREVPRAGLHALREDPRAGLHALREDPRAGLHALREVPRAGLHALREDPRAGLHALRDGGLARHGHGPKLKVSAWRRPGKCLVLLANLGEERVEAAVQLSPEAMGFAGAKFGQLQARDVDSTLLTYFDEDATTVKKPKMEDDVESAIKQDADGLPDLDEKPKDMSLADRRAKDPDGKFAWDGGTLRCPVRRHDYRVLLFTGKE